ncbi:MAG: hypothetical protein WCG01_01070 [bacterium]
MGNGRDGPTPLKLRWINSIGRPNFATNVAKAMLVEEGYDGRGTLIRQALDFKAYLLIYRSKT